MTRKSGCWGRYNIHLRYFLLRIRCCIGNSRCVKCFLRQSCCWETSRGISKGCHHCCNRNLDWGSRISTLILAGRAVVGIIRLNLEAVPFDRNRKLGFGICPREAIMRSRSGNGQTHWRHCFHCRRLSLSKQSRVWSLFLEVKIDIRDTHQDADYHE
jgi:hypothetical protein